MEYELKELEDEMGYQLKKKKEYENNINIYNNLDKLTIVKNETVKNISSLFQSINDNKFFKNIKEFFY